MNDKSDIVTAIGEKSGKIFVLYIVLLSVSAVATALSVLLLPKSAFLYVLCGVFALTFIGALAALIVFLKKPKILVEIYRDKVVLTEKGVEIPLSDIVFADDFRAKTFFAPALESLSLMTVRDVYIVTHVKDAAAVKKAIEEAQAAGKEVG